MSNRSGRSWYRLSSIVRPTAHSSRDPSYPHKDIEPPLSPPLSPKEAPEAKPSPVLSPRPSTKYESPKAEPVHRIVNSEHLKILDRTGRKLEDETTSQVLSSSRSIKNEPPNQQQTSYIDQTGSNNKNKNLMSPPLRPPSPSEVQEVEPTPTKNLEPPKPNEEHMTSPEYKQSRPALEEHETTYQTNIITLSEKTEVIHGPNEPLLLEADGDVLLSPQSVITISAENKGAMMEIIQSSSKNTPKTEESKSKSHNNNTENRFVNSNVQIINGSVVYNSSEIHHDPGVHLILNRKPNSGDGFIIKDHGNGGYTSSIN